MSQTSWRALALIAAFFGTFIALAPLSTVSAQAQFGTNWVAQFYSDPNLTTFVTTAAYPVGINANWGTGNPTDGANQPIAGVTNDVDGYSARFAGTQSIAAGVYNFTTVSDDGVRLLIDGNVIINNFTGGGLRTNSALVTLTGGTYTIILEYTQQGGSAQVQLSWTLASATTLTPVGPTPTVTPVVSGSVVGVRGLAVRTGPYLGASLVAVARPETQLTFLARNKSEGIFTWYRVSFGENNREGWVSGRYLQLTGDPNLLPEQGSVFDTIDGAPDVGVIGTTRSNMNLRVRPSERTARLAVIPWGDRVTIVGRTVQGGKNFWYQVRWQDKLGWILAAYVRVRGDINNVPVR
ncbi:MAG: SH3 domain-containing protein [Anaerolineae bacterium]|nr:SH3 domain-containing protein [Anaerolineae bacterium]MDW8173401.1 SH3 domain-containing protein [Anaerolineae bacterium]